MADRENSYMVGGLMLLAGGILGAGIALLFAPQSGKKTRRDIARYAKKAKHKAEDAVDEFSSNLHDVVDSLGDKAEELLDKGKDLAYDAKKEILRSFEEGQARLEKQKARLSKLIG
jgi:gas vesicle protein